MSLQKKMLQKVYVYCEGWKWNCS